MAEAWLGIHEHDVVIGHLSAARARTSALGPIGGLPPVEKPREHRLAATDAACMTGLLANARCEPFHARHDSRQSIFQVILPFRTPPKGRRA